MLTLGKLIFMRLYFHHMAGHLGSFDDLKKRLIKYLDGRSFVPICEHLEVIFVVHDVVAYLDMGEDKLANGWSIMKILADTESVKGLYPGMVVGKCVYLLMDAMNP